MMLRDDFRPKTTSYDGRMIGEKVEKRCEAGVALW